MMSPLFRHLVAGIAVWVGASQCALAQSVESQISATAKNLSKVLTNVGHSSATLKVDGPTTYPSSGPALIKEVLGGELGKLGVTIKRFGADVGIAAVLKVQEVKDQETGKVTSISLRLQINIVDRNDQPIGSIEPEKINVVDKAEVARMLGIPFEFGDNRKLPSDLPSGDGPPINTVILDAVRNPHQIIQRDTVVRAREDGAFGLEILVGGRARPAAIEDGFAFIELREQDECEIRLINDAPYEVAAKLTLDGIDCFFFSQTRASMWIIPPNGSTVVKGWQLDGNRARTFRIVPFENSVAAQAGAIGDIGVISATFFRTFPINQEIPASDRPDPSTKSLGVGAGDEFGNKVQKVQRQFGRIRGSVPVRYEKPKLPQF